MDNFRELLDKLDEMAEDLFVASEVQEADRWLWFMRLICSQYVQSSA